MCLFCRSAPRVWRYFIPCIDFVMHASGIYRMKLLYNMPMISCQGCMQYLTSHHFVLNCLSYNEHLRIFFLDRRGFPLSFMCHAMTRFNTHDIFPSTVLRVHLPSISLFHSRNATLVYTVPIQPKLDVILQIWHDSLNVACATILATNWWVFDMFINLTGDICHSSTCSPHLGVPGLVVAGGRRKSIWNPWRCCLWIAGRVSDRFTVQEKRLSWSILYTVYKFMVEPHVMQNFKILNFDGILAISNI